MIMPPRRVQPQETEPDIPSERAYVLLSEQLEKLQAFKTRSYQEAEANEAEFYQFTEKLVLRSFGSASSNYRNFSHSRSAGSYQRIPYGGGVDHRGNQSNFLARITAYENALKSNLAELKLDLPDDGIKGVYEAGQEYEFYADVKSLIGLAHTELFVIDPYLSTEIFDTYAASIPRTVQFRLLGTNVPATVLALGQKYASGGNFQFRSSDLIHDRVIFVDTKAWVCGQSLKDAAKKKPTYIVEIDEALMRPVYEGIWGNSRPLI
jgi:hypothetical protein